MRKDQDPPYVAPKGTLSCTLPLLLSKTIDKDGFANYVLSVTFVDQPFRLADCGVTYYDGTKNRVFKPDGDGYDDVYTPGTLDGFSAYVDDFGQTKYPENQFMMMGIGNSPAILWAAEIRDDEKPHVPIVSNCHMEIPPL
jgi:hypothetical protein